jgi:quinoprotein glucose dehydrogenase
MPNTRRFAAAATLAVSLALSPLPAHAQSAHSESAQTDGWPAYGHDAGGTRFSPLTQINRNNVSKLKVAWTFHVEDLSDGADGRKRSGLETTPILVDGTLYLTTGYNRVFALDPETGKQKWVYDPMIDTTVEYGDGLINRGVATWLDSTSAKGQPCHRRIYELTLDARLISLDGATGEPCAGFGNYGQVSLRDVARYRFGWYHMTSAPTVIGDVVVVGSAIDDNSRVNMASGVVRGFNARTGALVWKWEPLPPNAPDSASTTDGAKVWKTGAGNAWSGIVADPERDLVFVPTGSASPDYYGGKRPGDDKWANSIVALRGKTGEFVWGFQLVHHDLWDYDSAAPPLLTTIQHDGKSIPVVIVGNKTGFLYVFNRETGAPIFPIVEKPVPQSDVPGEATSPTQPVPSAPPALVPQTLNVNDAWGLTPADRDYCKQLMSGLRNEGIFTPPSLAGSLTVPGNVGGMNWSGSAWDPARGLLLVNTNNLPAKVRVIPSDKFDAESDAHAEDGQYTGQWGSGYGMFRTFILAKEHRLPCAPPPWGTLAAVNLSEGKIVWQVPLGSFVPMSPAVPAGAISLGGPIVTAGGLVFIAGAVRDPEFRAFDVDTGKELWKAQLPATGAAVPMTYQLTPTGKQFVVIAAGGHGNVGEEKLGDSIVAYTLP